MQCTIWQVLARSTVSWPEAAIIEEVVQGPPSMIPAAQKQLNTAFPKLTISYVTRRDTEQCLWVNSSIPWLQNFRNDKLLYSGWGKLCI